MCLRSLIRMHIVGLRPAPSSLMLTPFNVPLNSIELTES